MHPIIAAKMATTIDHIGGGRLGLNIVMGWASPEMFDFSQREHDERYAYGQEWVDFVERLWSAPERFDHESVFLNCHDVESYPKPSQGPRPVLTNAGNSPAGMTFSSRNVDFNVAAMTTIEDMADYTKKLRELARTEDDREVSAMTYGLVVARDTELTGHAPAGPLRLPFALDLEAAAGRGLQRPIQFLADELNGGLVGADLARRRLDDYVLCQALTAAEVVCREAGTVANRDSAGPCTRGAELGRSEPERRSSGRAMGVAHLGRFSAHYRARFGASPQRVTCSCPGKLTWLTAALATTVSAVERTMPEVAEGTRPKPPQYPIESVDNALKILLLFGERSEVRLTDISDYLGVASSTAHRMLAMLLYRGFVQQDARTKVYRPGTALTGVAYSILQRFDFRAELHPYLERLNVELRETVHLGLLDGTVVRFIDAIESPQAVRVASRLGMSMPAPSTSTGKAMLAQMTQAEVHALFTDESLDGLTERSLRSRTELDRQLVQIRKRGYAVSSEESEQGVSSVAVAFAPNRAPARLAFNVSLPTSRMSRQDQARIGAALIDAVQAAGAVLHG